MAPAGSPAELVACSLAVKRALELCGKRLMTRGRRSAYADVPAHELHTSIPFDRDPDELLAGAWDSLCDTLGAAACDRLTPVLDAYVRRLLNTRAPFTVEGLAAALDDARDPGPDGG